MKRFFTFCLFVGILIPSSGQSTKLSLAYSEAAIKVLNEMDDTEFHAFHYARDVAAKSAADKHSVEQIKAFLLIHSLDVQTSKSMFADEKTHRNLLTQEDCATQWKTNLRYQNAKVPAVCGIKF
jgi:hypothetical protein